MAVVGRGPTLWNITIIGSKGTIEIADRDEIRHIGADNYDGWGGTERGNLAPPLPERPAVATPDEEFVAAISGHDLDVSDVQRGLVVAQLSRRSCARWRRVDSRSWSVRWDKPSSCCCS